MSGHKSGYDPYLFFEYEGQQLTYADIEARYGISRQMFYYRINTIGLSVKQAIECPNRRVHGLTYKDKLYTKQALADHAGIDIRTLTNRLKAGWSVTQAVELPVGIRYDSLTNVE